MSPGDKPTKASGEVSAFKELASTPLPHPEPEATGGFT